MLRHSILTPRLTNCSSRKQWTVFRFHDSFYIPASPLDFYLACQALEYTQASQKELDFVELTIPQYRSRPTLAIRVTNTLDMGPSAAHDELASCLTEVQVEIRTAVAKDPKKWSHPDHNGEDIPLEPIFRGSHGKFHSDRKV